jgi:shikimate dehydrogenase
MDDCLIPDTSFFHPELIISDVIYNPRKTKLLQLAEAAGLASFNGMYMLLYQGAESFKLWTGQEMPVELVKKELFS